MRITLGVLETAVPQENETWKPHHNLMMLGSLATDILFAAVLMDRCPLEKQEITRWDADTRLPLPRCVLLFYEYTDSIGDSISRDSDEILETPLPLIIVGRTIFTMPRGAVLRYWLSLIIDRRAQLVLYLRMLDIPAPQMYEHRADDKQPASQFDRYRLLVSIWLRGRWWEFRYCSWWSLTHMTISQMMLPEFDQEMANSRRVLEAVPEDNYSWKPHEKSMTLGRLAGHVAEMPGWAIVTINQDKLELTPGMSATTATSKEQILSVFDKSLVIAREALAGASDETLMANWSLIVGGHNVFTMPRTAVLRSMVMNHMIHHRAQLGVYLRLLDVKVPGVYGPTADDK